MAAGQVAPGDGGHAGSKNAPRPPLAASAVSSAVMKLNEGSGSARSVSGTGRSLVATRKENN